MPTAALLLILLIIALAPYVDMFFGGRSRKCLRCRVVSRFTTKQEKGRKILVEKIYSKEAKDEPMKSEISHGLIMSDIGIFYSIYRQYMDTESNLINNRMTWLLAINGFLYTSLSFILTKPASCNKDSYIVLWMLSAVGILVSFFSFLAILDAKRVGKTLEDHIVKSWAPFEDEDGTCYFLLSNNLRLPYISAAGLSKKNRVGSQASRAIPLVLILSWLVVLLSSFSGKL